MKILLSILISSLVAWLLGGVLLTSPTVCVWDAGLGVPVPKAGTYKQERGENWVTCRYGGYGLEESDAERACLPGGKCLIFGDSYVEADMVSPEDRVQNVLTGLGILSIGVGVSGNSCVEDNHLMEIYNRDLPSVETNVVLVADISDILPPSVCMDFQQVVPAYPFRKQEGRLGEMTSRFHMQALRLSLKKLKDLRKEGVDLLGNSWRMVRREVPLSEDTSGYEEYWRGMFSAMKASAPNGRLMIVYAPIVPVIQGDGISRENPDEEIIRRFKAVGAEFELLGGGVVDISRELCESFDSTGQFPRGFFNTRPGAGHMNARGHRIVAQAIADVLMK